MPGIQRFITNETNALTLASIQAGSVRGVANAVVQRPVARNGTASIGITGVYGGSEEADYEFELLDTVVTGAPLVTAPILTGAGSGTIGSVAVTPGTLAQSYLVRLNDEGKPRRPASVSILGNLVEARLPGVNGNELSLEVDRSDLIFTPQAFSLLDDLSVGSDSVQGSGYAWDTQLLLGDGTIPANAHRVAFGDDTNNIYLTYATYDGSNTVYHFKPSIVKEVPKGSRVSFVTGGYTVRVKRLGVVVETHAGLITLHDLLSSIRQNSTELIVPGVVAFDRTPEGAASLELPLNTSAYVQSNSGEGGAYATGFTAVTLQSSSPTELIVATCFAVDSRGATGAGLGAELWSLEGSVSGVLSSRLSTGVAFVGDTISLTIPPKLPEGYSASVKGTFQAGEPVYAARQSEEVEPPICVTSLTLGSAAIDQTITLQYKRKPLVTDCDCEGMAGVSFDPACLGLDSLPTEGNNMGYNAGALTRVTNLYTWGAVQVRLATEYVERPGFLAHGGFQVEFTDTTGTLIPNPNSLSPGSATSTEPFVWRQTSDNLQTAINSFNEVLIAVQNSVPGLAAWDMAVEEFKADVEQWLGQGLTKINLANLSATATEDLVAGDFVSVNKVATSSSFDLTATAGSNIPAHAAVRIYKSPAGVVQFWAYSILNVVGEFMGYAFNNGLAIASGANVTLQTGGIIQAMVFNDNTNNIQHPFPYHIEYDGTIRAHATAQFLGPLGVTILNNTIAIAPGSSALLPVRFNTANLFGTQTFTYTAAKTSSLSKLEDEVGIVLATTLTGAAAPIQLSGNTVALSTVLPAGQVYLSKALPGKPQAGLTDSVATPITFKLFSLGAGVYELQKFVLYGNPTGQLVHRERYEARLAQTLATAGINPAGKFDANAVSGDGCWQDYPDPYFWEVTGSVGGNYQRAYTGHPYVSSKLVAGHVVNGVVQEGEAVWSTKEFGFVINVKCPQYLKVGDAVTLTINDGGQPQTYQVGDRLSLEVVSARPIAVTGGSDGNSTQVWDVSSSLIGPLPSYTYNPALPVPYSSPSLSFALTPGTIPFAKGDTFSFAVEGGHFRWRKLVSGIQVVPWNTLAVTQSALALDSGLSMQFSLGAAPSLVTGDKYKYRALQPYAVSNLLLPDFERWEWGSSPSVVQDFDLGVPASINTIGFSYHTLPATAIVTVRGSLTSTASWDWSVSFTNLKDTMATTLAAIANTRYLRLEITNAPGAGIGWFFAGTATFFTYNADCTLSSRYNVEQSGSDFNPASYYKGRGTSADVVFPEGSLLEEDYDKLVNMVDYLKQNSNQAFVFLPQVTRPGAFAVQLEQDSVDIQDVYGFQSNQGVPRRMSASLPLKPVYF